MHMIQNSKVAKAQRQKLSLSLSPWPWDAEFPFLEATIVGSSWVAFQIYFVNIWIYLFLFFISCMQSSLFYTWYCIYLKNQFSAVLLTAFNWKNVSFFIFSSIKRHLGCFWSHITTNNTAVQNLVYAPYLCVSVYICKGYV